MSKKTAMHLSISFLYHTKAFMTWIKASLMRKSPIKSLNLESEKVRIRNLERRTPWKRFTRWAAMRTSAWTYQRVLTSYAKHQALKVTILFKDRLNMVPKISRISCLYTKTTILPILRLRSWKTYTIQKRIRRVTKGWQHQMRFNKALSLKFWSPRTTFTTSSQWQVCSSSTRFKLTRLQTESKLLGWSKNYWRKKTKHMTLS